MAVMALAAVFVTSCQSIADPKVSFNSVEIAGISLSGVTLLAHLDVENPNSFSIPMPKAEWRLFINDVFFANGVMENTQTIRAGETVTLSVPVNVGYENLFRTISSLIGMSEAPYNLIVGLRFPIPLLERKLFERNYTGVLPLPLRPW